MTSGAGLYTSLSYEIKFISYDVFQKHLGGAIMTSGAGLYTSLSYEIKFISYDVFQKHLGGAIMTSGAGLVELDLSDNAFGPLGVEGLVELLKSSSCYTLQELRLNNNGLGIGGGKVSLYLNEMKDFLFFF